MCDRGIDFSVLMTIYVKTEADWVNDTFKSIYNQSLPANELVVILDGKLTPDHYKILDIWEKKFEGKFKRIDLEQNVGLPRALNIGIEQCNNHWIARMDSDDLMVKNRLQKQSDFILNNDVDIVGAWVREFDEEMKNPFGIRKVPVKHEEIIKFAKWRCPMNHMSVCYKKTIIQEVGGYNENMKRSQDYALWSKLIMNGYKFGNISEVLIEARTGDSFYLKRNSLNVIKYDYQLRRYMYEIGLVKYYEFLLGLLFRISIRITPRALILNVYSLLRK